MLQEEVVVAALHILIRKMSTKVAPGDTDEEVGNLDANFENLPPAQEKKSPPQPCEVKEEPKPFSLPMRYKMFGIW
jgi:hypothetical protein